MVVGGSGFLGSAIVSRARETGVVCRSLSSIRVAALAPDDAWRAVREWLKTNPSTFEALCADLDAMDVVVNAAGLAAPGSTNRRALYAANTVQPAVLALAARQTGVRRLVHLSTAAVQGRLDPLDETTSWAPASPYAESKAGAERALLWPRTASVPNEVLIYRPTSVHGAGREITERLARWAAAAPALPVSGSGQQPVPVSLVQNVAAGVVFAATSPHMEPVVLQPSEGITARRLLEIFQARRIVSLPSRPVGMLLRALAGLGQRSASFEARLRRAELLLRGQRTEARHLLEAGFQLCAGHDSWERLVSVARGGPAVSGVSPGGHL